MASGGLSVQVEFSSIDLAIGVAAVGGGGVGCRSIVAADSETQSIGKCKMRDKINIVRLRRSEPGILAGDIMTN